MKIKIFRGITPYHISGMTALIFAAVFFLINYKLIFIPVLFFLFICAVAPFVTWSSFFLPVISNGSSEKKSVALTFDDGPDIITTPAVLEILSKYVVKATFFVIGRKAAEYPEIIRRILEQGHSIENHSYNHDPLLMLRTKQRLYNEIKTTRDLLLGFGIKSMFFRPPAGITNPRLRKVMLKLDMHCVNWSIRAFDAGNRNINGLACKILKKIKSGDIILLHDTVPKNNDVKKLIQELDQLLKGLEERGLSIIPLSDIISKKI